MPELPADAAVTIHLADAGVANHIVRLAHRDDWYAVVETEPPSARYASPWDYKDDGPSGPELHTPDLAEAIAFVRDTAAAHLARVEAERAAAEADLEQAAKEARNARRRTRRAAQRG